MANSGTILVCRKHTVIGSGEEMLIVSAAQEAVFSAMLHVARKTVSV
jgi:hypothetical protein